jgi:hypothetical protein
MFLNVKLLPPSRSKSSRVTGIDIFYQWKSPAIPKIYWKLPHSINITSRVDFDNCFALFFRNKRLQTIMVVREKKYAIIVVIVISWKKIFVIIIQGSKNYSGAIEAHPGAVEAHCWAKEAQPRAT